MKTTIRLYTISTNNIGTQFILKEYPELQLYNMYSKRQEIKRLNIEQYFRGINKDYKDYVKMLYGPVFGMEDPRNGFAYEHNTTGEVLLVDANDIPITYETCDVLYGDLAGLFKTDTLLQNGIITDHHEMTRLSDMVENAIAYNDLIRDEWVPSKSFLIIEKK